MAAKLDALIEGCNNTCLRSAPQIEDRTNLQITHPGLPPVTKRKRLSEANLDVYSPCQVCFCFSVLFITTKKNDCHPKFLRLLAMFPFKRNEQTFLWVAFFFLVYLFIFLRDGGSGVA